MKAVLLTRHDDATTVNEFNDLLSEYRKVLVPVKEKPALTTKESMADKFASFGGFLKDKRGFRLTKQVRT